MHNSRSRGSYSTEDIDEKLKRLAIAAQQHPPQSKQRKEALSELFKEILRPGRLWKPRSNNFNENIYNDAVQELLLYVCQQIEKYDPKRAEFLVWVNALLPTRFFHLAYSKANDKYVKQISKSWDLDNTSDNLSLLEKVRECVDTDQSELFKNECIKNYPQVNFKLLLERRLAGDTWEDISGDLGVGSTTLSNFYQRSLRKFSSYIRAYVRQ